MIDIFSEFSNENLILLGRQSSTLPIDKFIFTKSEDDPLLPNLNNINEKSSGMISKKRSIKNEDDNNNSNIEKFMGKDVNEILNNEINTIQKNNSFSDSDLENLSKFYCNLDLNENKEYDKIQKENIIYERGSQKDNFSLKLLKYTCDWILKIINEKIQKYSNIKIYRPNYNIFTHNTNLVDLYIFLDISYKNILCMTPEDKTALNQLLIEIGIKKRVKKKKVEINKNTKDYKYAKKLLLSYNYIDESNMEQNIDINYLIIQLLINEGLKNPNEEILYKNDKDNIIKLLIKKGEKKSFNLQVKNKNNIKEIEKLIQIDEFNMKLKDIILSFYNSGNEFKVFSKKVEKINNYFKYFKNYSLLDNANNGFIKMIEEDCHLTKEKKDKIKHLTNHFNNRDLNVEEIQKYRISLSKKV